MKGGGVDEKMIREVEHACAAGDVKGVNGVVELLQCMQRLQEGHRADELSLKCLHALRRCFLELIDKGEIRKPSRTGLKRSAAQAGLAAGEGSKRVQGIDSPPVGGTSAASAADTGRAEEGPMQVFRTWLYSQYSAFVSGLLDILDAPDLKSKAAAFRTLMELVKKDRRVRGEGIIGGGQDRFASDLFIQIVTRLVTTNELSEQLVQILRTEYVALYFDVRYWLLVAVKVAADRAASGLMRGQTVQNIFRLLMLVTVPATEDALTSFWVSNDATGEGPKGNGAHDAGSDEDNDSSSDKSHEDDDVSAVRNETTATRRPPCARLASHRRALSEAWLTCIKLELTPALYRDTCQFVAQHVVGNMLNPLQLSDFLTASYEQGGLTALVALEALVSLVQKHNLEYPRFYASLYKLLTPQALYSRHRARFFRLLRVCLQSQYVPAGIITAFAKRLARLALQGPPPAVVFVLGLCSMMLRRHPECRPLLHRASQPGAPALDTFDADADDPAQACREGMETSLWEVAALQQHYFPAAASVARAMEAPSLDDPKTPDPFDLNEFAGYKYAEFFEQEVKRRLKETPLAYQKPATPTLFQDGDVFEGMFQLP